MCGENIFIRMPRIKIQAAINLVTQYSPSTDSTSIAELLVNSDVREYDRARRSSTSPTIIKYRERCVAGIIREITVPSTLS